jgi:hypothetical protein
MARDFITLSGMPQAVLGITCDLCQRLERLTRQYGWDAKLTDLLPALVADCPKRRSVTIYDRCKRCLNGGYDRDHSVSRWAWLRRPLVDAGEVLHAYRRQSPLIAVPCRPQPALRSSCK